MGFFFCRKVPFLSPKILIVQRTILFFHSCLRGENDDYLIKIFIFKEELLKFLSHIVNCAYQMRSNGGVFMGIRFIKISVIYFVIGACIGLFMSMTHSFALTPVHVHINLLGWTSMTLAGIIYYLFPSIADNKLAKTHFWLHNVSLPVMMLSLTFVVYGNASFIPVTAVGGSVLVLAIIIFSINVLFYLRKTGSA